MYVSYRLFCGGKLKEQLVQQKDAQGAHFLAMQPVDNHSQGTVRNKKNNTGKLFKCTGLSGF